MAKVSKANAEKWLGNVPEDKRFWCQDGRYFQNLQELGEALVDMSEDIFRTHVNEAKNDFSNWIRDVIGDEELSQKLRERTTNFQAAMAVSSRVTTLKRALKSK